MKVQPLSAEERVKVLLRVADIAVNGCPFRRSRSPQDNSKKPKRSEPLSNPPGQAGAWKPVDDKIPCRKCGVVGQIEHSTWESDCGGFEDEHYRCRACGKDWWVDGPDA